MDNIIYEAVQTENKKTIWIAYHKDTPLIVGSGNTCYEALDDLTEKIRAILVTVMDLRKKCDE